MAVTLPNGTTFHVENGLGASLSVTVATNASPCVMTSTTHGLSNGDFVKVASGWSRINNKVYRVANVSADTFELEGTDTSDTSVYSAGSGIGSVKKITGWTELQQILSNTTSGGEQQFATYRFLADDFEQRIPTIKSASGIEFQVADDPTLAGYQLASTANDDRVARGVKALLPNGSVILYNGYVSLNKTPSMNADQPMACQVTVSFLNEPVRYSA